MLCLHLFWKYFSQKFIDLVIFDSLKFCRYRGHTTMVNMKFQNRVFLRAKSVNISQWFVGSSLHLSIIGRNEFRFVLGGYTRCMSNKILGIKMNILVLFCIYFIHFTKRYDFLCKFRSKFLIVFIIYHFDTFIMYMRIFGGSYSLQLELLTINKGALNKKLL